MRWIIIIKRNLPKNMKEMQELAIKQAKDFKSKSKNKNVIQNKPNTSIIKKNSDVIEENKIKTVPIKKSKNFVFSIIEEFKKKDYLNVFNSLIKSDEDIFIIGLIIVLIGEPDNLILVIVLFQLLI